MINAPITINVTGLKEVEQMVIEAHNAGVEKAAVLMEERKVAASKFYGRTIRELKIGND